MLFVFHLLQEKEKLLSDLDEKEQRLQREKEAKDALVKKIQASSRFSRLSV